VQDRVLGVDVSSTPLFRAIPGFLTLSLRGGIRLSEKQDVTIEVENITDRIYRGISWGLPWNQRICCQFDLSRGFVLILVDVEIFCAINELSFPTG
jgi:hypothetical protein